MRNAVLFLHILEGIQISQYGKPDEKSQENNATAALAGSKNLENLTITSLENNTLQQR